MRAVVCVVLALVAASAVAQDRINTGEGLFSLFFPGGGALELANVGVAQETTLSEILPQTFSFESWIMSPQPNDGFYKTVVARWDRGPTEFHNRWADFNLQVQSSGDLNFFMGNGETDMYGFLMTPMSLQPGQWTHVAFSVETAPGAVNPTRASFFINGVEVSTQQWMGGTRQERKNRNIFLGDYFNQDMDHKWWRGYLDETRFWGYARTSVQITDWLSRVVPSDTPNLLAYYRFNEGSGLAARDETAPAYHGRLASGSGTPQWAVSSAKINVDRAVASEEVVTFALPGLSPSGALSFTYVVKTLPTSGTLLANGVAITEAMLPFSLESNQITFRAPATRGVQTSFRYYGAAAGDVEEMDTIVTIQVGEEPCVVDACGRCGGDNSTCTCLALPYNGYSLADIERILLLYEIEQTLDLLNQLETKLERMMRTLTTAQATDLQVIIDEVQVFNSQCLLVFCQKIDKYMDQLAAIAP